jgi:hypothetical protein
MICITNLNWQYIRANPRLTIRGGNSAAAKSQEEIIMTSFVHVEQPTEHPGVVRFERAARLLASIWRQWVPATRPASGSGHSDATAQVPPPAQRAPSRSRSAALLLAAMVSALLVVANQLIDTWTEGHLLAAWVLMWTVAFAALALLASPAARAAARMRAGWKRWNAARRQAAADDKLWEVALADARVMADIGRAMSADAAPRTRPYV